MDVSIGPVKQLSLRSARPNDSENTEITYVVTFSANREVGVTIIGSKDNWRVSEISDKIH